MLFIVLLELVSSNYLASIVGNHCVQSTLKGYIFLVESTQRFPKRWMDHGVGVVAFDITECGQQAQVFIFF